MWLSNSDREDGVLFGQVARDRRQRQVLDHLSCLWRGLFGFEAHIWAELEQSVKSILIIEDHPFVAEAMSSMLVRSTADLEPVICPDAQSALMAIGDPTIDWFRIFLDLDVPGAHGLSLARDIQQLGFHVRCCVVTALDRQDFIHEVRGMGFLGYLVKARPYREFEATVNQVLAGQPTFPAADRSIQEPTVRLTRKQALLLEYVQRGLSSKEIASTLFQSEGTINNSINAAMKALDATSRTHAVARALELGLLTLSSREVASAAQYRRV
jgi:DNA-binding NarL/FixJ family response regulator